MVALDCGAKHNILRNLSERGVKVTVLPPDTTADEILKYNPDGLFVSNASVFRGDATEALLVLDAGRKTQRVLKARLVRADRSAGLALLRRGRPATDAAAAPAMPTPTLSVMTVEDRQLCDLGSATVQPAG